MLSHAVQYVGDAYDHSTPLGPIDGAGFKAAIDDFPWAAQHAQWDKAQEGPLPCLILRAEVDQRELWVTALGGEPGDAYQLQSVSIQMRKSLFGKPKAQHDATAFDVDDRATVDQLIDLFASASYAQLDAQVQRLARESD
ncbi:hypothetical protein PGB34_02905 [Xenophilus arseniciresistens]|uniref:Uncharacterized protein n=1 Tax=Xenophilus arseniciresistens TaxID=1283306 RepID=A0AAE3N8N2_9BURK|nr:hypothetical protein [Xenophilus arseniciresistens]MDA7415304.1 hypothetical protein [Xenophilus arseniciresistens]